MGREGRYETINAFKTLVSKLWRERDGLEDGCSWMDNTEMDYKETCCENVDSIYQAQSRD